MVFQAVPAKIKGGSHFVTAKHFDRARIDAGV
jgi:hypothetical protein